MRHIKIFYGIFTILLATLTFTGCTSDDDDNNHGSAEEIVGNWARVDESEAEFYSFKSNGNVIWQIINKNYNTGEWYYPDYARGTYRISGKQIVLTLDDGDEIHEEIYNYRIKNDKLTLNNESWSGSDEGSFITYTRTTYRSLEECLE